jgi:hypothetical protein
MPRTADPELEALWRRRLRQQPQSRLTIQQFCKRESELRCQPKDKTAAEPPMIRQRALASGRVMSKTSAWAMIRAGALRGGRAESRTRHAAGVPTLASWIGRLAFFFGRRWQIARLNCRPR